MDILNTLQQLAKNPPWAHLARYELMPQGFTWFWLRMCMRLRTRVATYFHSYTHFHEHHWSAGLKHAPRPEAQHIVLLWSEGLNKEEQRAACEALQMTLEQARHLTPVLVTDVADFAFYSRLHWQVEYLPSLQGDHMYKEKKRHYLTWCYRKAHMLSLPCTPQQIQALQTLPNAKV